MPLLYYSSNDPLSMSFVISSRLRGAPDAPHAHAGRVWGLLRRGFAAILRGWGDIVVEVKERSSN